MTTTSVNIIRKRPGPLSKTKNKEFEKANTINENSNDHIELILDNDKIKKSDENKTIVVSADSFNNFEKRKSESINSTETVRPELKFVRTYAKIKKFPPQLFINNESQNIEKNNETTKTNESVNGQIKQKNESRNNLLHENYTELSIEPINKIKNAQSANTKIEEIVIKGEIHETIDKATDNADKEGEPPLSVEVASETSSSVVSKTPSPVDPKKNRVFIIKNLAGKKVTLIPKSAPVVINNSAVTSSINSSENKSESISVLKKPITTSAETKTIKILAPKNAKLNQPQVMKISDVNKSQKYFNDSTYCNIKIQKTESLSSKRFFPQKSVDQIDLTGKHDKGMKNNVQSNTMPGFSKILQVLTGSSSQTSKISPVDDVKIPIYVDCQTQTETLTILKDKAVQTENFMPSPTSSVEDLPNITNLLEYVFSTPKYSTGLDEVKKSDLIDMSKNIVMKGKVMSQPPKGEDGLKRQLFMDLKDCATFDFLGNKPIHNAVIENNLKLLKRQIFALRLRKISVDIENNQGQTALQLAVLHNCNMEIITTLILNGASANILDNEGNTLIHLTVINSNHFVLELVIKHLMDPVKEINRKNDEGLTALMIASIDSKPEMVDMLLRSKADPNLRDEKSGRTALFHAVELNCNFVINLLLKYRADPKVRNYFGLTALDAAKDLDIADSKILETERESNSLSNQTSVIVNMSANKINESTSTTGNKRGRPVPKQNDDAKKSKLSFVSSFRKVEINNVKNRPENSGASSGAGRRKRK